MWLRLNLLEFAVELIGLGVTNQVEEASSELPEISGLHGRWSERLEADETPICFNRGRD